MTEIWKDVVGSDIYEVSNLGRVRSRDRFVRAVSKRGNEFKRFVHGTMLTPGWSRGYLIVHIHPQGTVAVHLLVAQAFLPPQPPGTEVNHRDGVKAHNQASNLEWVTKSENQRHAVATGLNTQAHRVVDPRTGRVFPSRSEAAKAAGKAARKWGRA